MESLKSLDALSVNSVMDLAISLFLDMNIGLMIYHLEDLNDESTLKLIYANQQASHCTRTDLSKLVKKYIFEAFPGLAKTEIPEKYLQVASENVALDIGEVEYEGSNMETGYYFQRAFPMPEHCVGVIFKNITKRKKTEEMLKDYTAKLRRKNNELEKFVALASHDLNNPLTQVLLNANELARRTKGLLPEKDQVYLDKITQTSRRMSRILDDLLAYARAGKSSEPVEKVNLSSVVEDVLTDLEYRISETNATIEVGNLGTIEAIPIEMNQLFQNLTENALKYHFPDTPPIVKISGEVIDNFSKIQVADNGIGFDERNAAKIFQPFERLHEKNGHYKGSGIGLSTCLKIVQRHHGHITAKGKPGKGAVFTITLPLKQPR